MGAKTQNQIKLEKWVNRIGDRWLTDAYKAIARELNIPDTTVRRLLPPIVASVTGLTEDEVRRQKNLYHPPKNKTPQATIDKIMELHQGGQSPEVIAEQLGCAPITVERYIRKHNMMDNPVQDSLQDGSAEPKSPSADVALPTPPPVSKLPTLSLEPTLQNADREISVIESLLIIKRWYIGDTVTQISNGFDIPHTLVTKCIKSFGCRLNGEPSNTTQGDGSQATLTPDNVHNLYNSIELRIAEIAKRIACPENVVRQFIETFVKYADKYAETDRYAMQVLQYDSIYWETFTHGQYARLCGHLKQICVGEQYSKVEF